MEANDKAIGFFLGLLCGALAGTAAMSLFVPRSGTETREQISERGIELKHRAEDTVRKAQTVANETVAKVQTSAQELLQRDANAAGI